MRSFGSLAAYDGTGTRNEDPPVPPFHHPPLRYAQTRGGRRKRERDDDEGRDWPSVVFSSFPITPFVTHPHVKELMVKDMWFPLPFTLGSLSLGH